MPELYCWSPSVLEKTKDVYETRKHHSKLRDKLHKSGHISGIGLRRIQVEDILTKHDNITSSENLRRHYLKRPTTRYTAQQERYKTECMRPDGEFTNGALSRRMVPALGMGRKIRHSEIHIVDDGKRKKKTKLYGYTKKDERYIDVAKTKNTKENQIAQWAQKHIGISGVE